MFFINLETMSVCTEIICICTVVAFICTVVAFILGLHFPLLFNK